MKIVIGRDVMLDGLQKVFSIVPQKPTLPVLTNFLLRAENDTLMVYGTDMDISINTRIQCSVEEDGAVMVNAKRFLNIIRELPEGNAEIVVEDKKITVKHNKGDSEIMGMSASDYPELRDSIDGKKLGISGLEFVEMVDKTAFAVAVERTRIALTGVYWRFSPEENMMVATDGHRLALFGRKHAGPDIAETAAGEAVQTEITGETEAGTEAPGAAAEETESESAASEEVTEAGKESSFAVEVIVPQKALNQASRIVTGGEDLQSVVFGEKSIQFTFANTIVISKLIEGPYPNFRQVIPWENSKLVTIATTEFEAAVRRVAVLSNAVTHQIRLSIDSESVEISTTNMDIGGESHETLPVRYDGESIATGFNAMLLLEILRKIESDEVVLELETPTSASILKPVDAGETDELLYLIMPLRLND